MGRRKGDNPFKSRQSGMIDGKIKSFTGKILLAYESFRSAENNKIELGNEVKIYRWKDSNGNWSYSDKPNASVESKQVFLDPKDIVVLHLILS